MSVNYYLDSSHNEEGHIGRWTAGHFTAKAPEGVNSFADWKAMLADHRIFAEHGAEYTPEEMIRIVKPDPKWGRSLRQVRESEGEWMEEGVLFVRYDFF